MEIGGWEARASVDESRVGGADLGTELAWGVVKWVTVQRMLCSKLMTLRISTLLQSCCLLEVESATARVQRIRSCCVMQSKTADCSNPEIIAKATDDEVRYLGGHGQLRSYPRPPNIGHRGSMTDEQLRSVLQEDNVDMRDMMQKVIHTTKNGFRRELVRKKIRPPRPHLDQTILRAHRNSCYCHWGRRA